MIYNKNPKDQLAECFYGLAAVKYALENKDICEDSSLASHLQQIEWSLKDAIERIEADHKALVDKALILQTQKTPAQA